MYWLPLVWEGGREERTTYTCICLWAHILALGGNQFMVAVSGEGKSETGVGESGDLLCIPFLLHFWILYHLLTIAIQNMHMSKA